MKLGEGGCEGGSEDDCEAWRGMMMIRGVLRMVIRFNDMNL